MWMMFLILKGVIIDFNGSFLITLILSGYMNHLNVKVSILYFYTHPGGGGGLKRILKMWYNKNELILRGGWISNVRISKSPTTEVLTNTP